MPGLEIQIPLVDGAPLPYFDMLVPLDDVTYTLEFRWNERASAWYLNIYDESGTVPQLVGLKLVANWALGVYTTQRQPPGILTAIDTSGQSLDPALADLGTRVTLVYFSAAELGL